MHTVDNVADEGIERDPQRHGHVPAEGDEGQQKSDKDVTSPSMETPVVVGQEHRLLGELIIVLPWHLEELVAVAAVVVDGLGDTIHVQACKESCHERVPGHFVGMA